MNQTRLDTNSSLHFAWLATMLGNQKDALARLSRSLTGFGARGSMKPSHFQRFLLVLNQVADAKHQEALLISRIEAIEERHRFARKNDQLRGAPEHQSLAPAPQFTHQREAERPGMSLLWIFLLWKLFQARAFGQK